MTPSTSIPPRRRRTPDEAAKDMEDRAARIYGEEVLVPACLAAGPLLVLPLVLRGELATMRNFCIALALMLIYPLIKLVTEIGRGPTLRGE